MNATHDLIAQLRAEFSSACQRKRKGHPTLYECAQKLGLPSDVAERLVARLVASGRVAYVPAPTGLQAEFVE